MINILTKYIPNVIENSEELFTAIGDTLIMVLISGVISLILGVLVGVLLVVTKENNLLENKIINNILNKIIDAFRSIPFIILLFALLPFTRAIMKTAVGVKGSIIPLIFGTVPFLSRQVETALLEVSDGVIEAARAMGSSPREIIFRVYLREGLAGIIRGVTITIVSLIGLTAMAGAVGGGGLGDFAIRYGYQRNKMDVTYVTVVIILILVTIIQAIGNKIIKKITH